MVRSDKSSESDADDKPPESKRIKVEPNSSSAAKASSLPASTSSNKNGDKKQQLRVKKEEPIDEVNADDVKNTATRRKLIFNGLSISEVKCF